MIGFHTLHALRLLSCLFTNRIKACSASAMTCDAQRLPSRMIQPPAEDSNPNSPNQGLPSCLSRTGTVKKSATTRGNSGNRNASRIANTTMAITRTTSATAVSVGIRPVYAHERRTAHPGGDLKLELGPNVDRWLATRALPRNDLWGVQEL